MSGCYYLLTSVIFSRSAIHKPLLGSTFTYSPLQFLLADWKEENEMKSVKEFNITHRLPFFVDKFLK